MTVVALIGARALYLTYAWLLSSIVASWMSDRKGYGERVGLACGLLLTAAGVVIWVLWPAKVDSRWRRGRERVWVWVAGNVLAVAGVSLLLIAVGAVVRYVVLKLDLIGLIVMIAGVVGLISCAISLGFRAWLGREREPASTPPGAPRAGLLGSRWERFFTDQVVDAVIVSAIVAAGYLILDAIGLPRGLAFAIPALLGLLYRPLTVLRAGDANGQTLGKQMVGLRVVREDGQPMTIGTAMIRELVLKGIVGSLTGGLFLIVSGALSLGRPDRRTLHDRIAGTLVVRSEGRWVVAPDDVVRSPHAGEPAAQARPLTPATQ